MSLMKKGVISAIALSLVLSAPGLAQPVEGSWSSAAPLPGPRSELQAVELGGKIYAIGGNTVALKDGKLDIIPDSGINQVYDPAANSWRDLAPVPMGANHTGIAALAGKIYVGGGFRGRAHMVSTDQFFAALPRLSLSAGRSTRLADAF